MQSDKWFTVGFDATAAARQGAGIGRYARHLLAALAERQDSIRYHLYYCGGDGAVGELPVLDSRFRVRSLPFGDRVVNVIWHRARLPIPVQIVTGSFDLFHSPDFALPPTLGKPSIVTIHDLAFLRTPECAYPAVRTYLERVVPRSVGRARRIIAVSENTRRDIIDLLHVPAETVTTIYEGVDARFHPTDDRQKLGEVLVEHGICEPFLLTVGTLEPRKNYERLLEAYSLLRDRGATLPLVIAGRRGWMYDSIFSRLTELHLEEAVRFVQPDDRILVALYQAARAFVYPSLYEGFGIPPLEALACGAPVACSASSSLPEVVGDAALIFDPRDVDGIAAAMERLVADDDLCGALTARGPVQAAKFSWQTAAAKTVQMYREVGLDV